MVINKKNIADLDNLYIHDFEMTDFHYNSYMEKISMNLLSSRNFLKDIEIIFKGVIFLRFQDADFWSSSVHKEMNSIFHDEKFTYYHELIKEFKKTTSDENYFPDKLHDNLLEIIISSLTGGEIRILCNEIIVNEIS